MGGGLGHNGGPGGRRENESLLRRRGAQHNGTVNYRSREASRAGGTRLLAPPQSMPGELQAAPVAMATECKQFFPVLLPYLGCDGERLDHLRGGCSSQLSAWPAYASGQAILKNRKPCSVPEGQRYVKDDLGVSIAKPRYLEKLESYLRQELQALDLTKGKVQELRLQPYREVFEFFIEEFRTYKPLLASIKNEYEQTIAYLQNKVHSLEAVNAVLVTASDQCTRQVLEYQEQEKDEIVRMKKDRLHLLKLIDQMKEEKCSLETQVSMMRKTVAAEYLRYLNESDARKLLLIDLNEMYRLKEEMKVIKVPDEGKGEDSVKLTLALKMARQDLTKAQVELNTLKANYGDVVPRREFELQEQKYQELSEKMTTLQKNFDDLMEEHDTMLEIHKQVSEERDQYYNDFLNVQRTSTPRPDWSKCAEMFPGGATRWNSLAEGKTSDQLVDVLLEDLGASLLRERDTFVALGRNEKVPVYLRCDGLVRNKKLSIKEVVAILREIWRDKIASDAQKGRRSSLSEFFLNFFQKKYGEALAFDWTYSVYESIKLYRSNEAMSLFHHILTGKLDEGIYHSHLQQLSTLLKELSAVDTANTGELTAEQFTLGLRTAFPAKNNEQIQELVDAAGFKPDNPEDVLMYKLLFLEDEEGKTEPFVKKLRTQFVNDKQLYLYELCHALGNLMDVRPDDLRAAFCIVDPTINEYFLDSYICEIFGVTKEQLDPAVSLPVDIVMQRLKTADIRRHGPAVPAESKNPSLEETDITANI
ncbi:translin-associated factor X-interacting protein 1 [Tiliqua scincoides]|uniref:translin-associated factor X-interacting protein 1 n=1 Tax=Tiliqua scincoides TaxID=71010 RepID=UPI0034620A88